MAIGHRCRLPLVRAFHANDNKRNHVGFSLGEHYQTYSKNATVGAAHVNLGRLFKSTPPKVEAQGSPDKFSEEALLDAYTSSGSIHHLGREAKFERVPYWRKIPR